MMTTYLCGTFSAAAVTKCKNYIKMNVRKTRNVSSKPT